MIYNDVCPYCEIKMEKSENKDNSKSVEHLIPNVALSKKRGNGEGDFYACRRCNSAKSASDYVIAFVSKIQSDDTETALALVQDTLKKTGGKKSLIEKMESEKIESNKEVRYPMPIPADDVICYANYLAKGQYFKLHNMIYDDKKFVMSVLYANKGVVAPFVIGYFQDNETDPISDLEMNPYTESILGGECLIYAKDEEYLFIFNRYSIIGVRLLERTTGNIEIAENSYKKMQRIFSGE